VRRRGMLHDSSDAGSISEAPAATTLDWPPALSVTLAAPFFLSRSCLRYRSCVLTHTLRGGQQQGGGACWHVALQQCGSFSWRRRRSKHCGQDSERPTVHALLPLTLCQTRSK
jgi:hypothetical protein